MFLLAPDWLIRSNFTITAPLKSLPFQKNHQITRAEVVPVWCDRDEQCSHVRRRRRSKKGKEMWLHISQLTSFWQTTPDLKHFQALCANRQEKLDCKANERRWWITYNQLTSLLLQSRWAVGPELKRLSRSFRLRRNLTLQNIKWPSLIIVEHACGARKKLFWRPVSISVPTPACRTYLANEFSIPTLGALCD